MLLDLAAQSVNVLNQMRLFAVSPQARSRVNTAFVTCNFIGGAIGSAAATLLWSTGGSTGIALTGTGLGCVALAVWAIGRRYRSRHRSAPERRTTTIVFARFRPKLSAPTGMLYAGTGDAGDTSRAQNPDSPER